MNEDKIIEFYKKGYTIKWIIRKAISVNKYEEVKVSKKELQYWVESTILKYWESL